MKILIPFVYVALFLWVLQCASAEHGYSQTERDEMTALVENATAEDYLAQLEVNLYRNGEKL
jgi:hypothetical protein